MSVLVGGGGSVADGAPDSRAPRALTVQILSVVPDRIDPVQPIEVEFRVLNSGRVPLELPVSPHLSDLQPPDQSQSFTYLSLALAVNVIVGDAQLPIAGAPTFVELYGSAEDARTILVLGPATDSISKVSFPKHLPMPPPRSPRAGNPSRMTATISASSKHKDLTRRAARWIMWLKGK